jgi:hypothetical protein
MMPIEYQIDHDLRVVFAAGRGVVTPQDVFAYQREVWSRPEVGGYNELFDLSEAERIVAPSSRGLQEMAAMSARMDLPALLSKFAIIAPENLEFGIARMYGTYRELEERGTKKVAVFRTRPEALAWLGVAERS